MKLYHSQFTRSGRARWMLEELEIPYDCERLALSKGEHKSPEFLAINPHGAVPALVDGDLRLNESSAIVMHLADTHPEKKLAPPVGSKERADYYRWMVYVPSSVDPALEAITFHAKLLPEAQRIPAIAEDGRRKWSAVSKVLENAIGDRQYIVGDSFTAADIVVCSAIGWVAFLGMAGDHPKLMKYNEALMSRPAAKRAYAD